MKLQAADVPAADRPRPRFLVVGGQSRNVGKTSLACSLIRAMPERGWTAVKITQFGHGICSADGKPCDCAVDSMEHPFALTAERNDDGRSDTSRLLAAGAREVLWLRVAQGRLSEAMPALERRLAECDHVLIESNSVVDFLRPDVYVTVLDERVEDFKASARRLLARADAVASVTGAADAGGKPLFAVDPPEYCSPELTSFVQSRLRPEPAS